MFDLDFARKNRSRKSRNDLDLLALRMLDENIDILFQTVGFSSCIKSIFELDLQNDPVSFVKLKADMLKSDGVFAGVVFAKGNIDEISTAFLECSYDNRFFARKNPSFSIESLASLLSSNGFFNVVVECVDVKKTFSNIKEAMLFIKNNGHGIAISGRSKFVQKGLFLEVLERNNKSFELTFKFLIFTCKLITKI